MQEKKERQLNAKIQVICPEHVMGPRTDYAVFSTAAQPTSAKGAYIQIPILQISATQKPRGKPAL